MTAKWSFPPTDSPLTEGINAYEIDNKDSPIQTLVREICQNSNDSSHTRPVRIEFKKFKVETSKIPDIDGLIETLRRCYDMVAQYRNNKAPAEEYSFMLKELEKQELVVMRISDFGTTGLEGSSSDSDTSSWYSFIAGRGVSDKVGSSGGSKGRGKDSINRMSKIRTIFVSTLDIEGNVASAGISYQITHYDSNHQKHESRGFLYDKNESYTLPFPFNSLDCTFTRNEPGTDIYIIGFDESDNDDYQMKMAVIRDFFVSILDGNLEITVDTTEINKNTLDSVMQELADKAKQSEEIDEISELIDCYRQNPVFSCNKYEIYLKKSENWFYISSVRTGMTIDRTFHKTPNEHYIGLVKICNDETSALLTKSEDISHTSWKPDVAPNSYRQEIKLLINEIKKEIRNAVNRLESSNSGDRKDAMGLNRYLPINGNIGTEEHARKEFLYDPILTVKAVRKNSVTSKNEHVAHSGAGEILPTKRASVEELKTQSNPVKTNLVPRLHPNANRDDVVPGDDESFKRIFEKEADIREIRTICIDTEPVSYRILFDSSENNPLFLVLYIAGDDEESNKTKTLTKAHVYDAYESKDKPLCITDDIIGPLKYSGLNRRSITVSINYPNSCGIAVAAFTKREEKHE